MFEEVAEEATFFEGGLAGVSVEVEGTALGAGGEGFLAFEDGDGNGGKDEEAGESAASGAGPNDGDLGRIHWQQEEWNVLNACQANYPLVPAALPLLGAG